MNALLATAPGKAVLLGEYAVLDGAPALVMAIDRRARVTLEPVSGRTGSIEAPQLGIEPVGFEIDDDGGVQWLCSPEDWAVFRRTASVIEHLLANAGRRFGGVSPFRALIDTGELFAGQVKLGLGSSAAVAVALDAAISAHASGRRAHESPDAVLARLLPAYRGSQGGQGSGIDLAASLHGGLVGYRLGGERPEIRALTLPQDVHWRLLWTGTAASTPEMVMAWRQWRRADSGRAREIMAEMHHLCLAAMEAVDAGDGAGLIGLIGDYGDILGTMGDRAGLPVVTAVQQRAMNLAAEHGVGCKPCGAGGGDLGLVAATDSPALEAVIPGLNAIGLEMLDAGLASSGVSVSKLRDGND